MFVIDLLKQNHINIYKYTTNMIKTNKHKGNLTNLTFLLFKKNNKNLEKRLIPDLELPIYGNSFTNPNDEIFHQPIKNKNDKKC